MAHKSSEEIFFRLRKRAYLIKNNVIETAGSKLSAMLDPFYSPTSRPHLYLAVEKDQSEIGRLMAQSNSDGDGVCRFAMSIITADTQWQEEIEGPRYQLAIDYGLTVYIEMFLLQVPGRVPVSVLRTEPGPKQPTSNSWDLTPQDRKLLKSLKITGE